MMSTEVDKEGAVKAEFGALAKSIEELSIQVTSLIGLLGPICSYNSEMRVWSTVVGASKPEDSKSCKFADELYNLTVSVQGITSHVNDTKARLEL